MAIDVDIPYGDLSVNPGERLTVNLYIYKLGDTSARVDRTLMAYLIDADGDKISEVRKDIAIEKEVKTIVSFNIPTNAKPGRYRIEAVFEDKTSGADFIVESVEEEKIDDSVMPIIIGFTLMAVILMVLFYYDRKINKSRKDVDVKDLIK